MAQRFTVLLVALTVLLALPFSLKGEDSLEVMLDDTRLTLEDIDTMPTFKSKPIVVDTDPLTSFVVYYIDTVGWCLAHAGHIVQIFDDGKMLTSDSGFFFPDYEQPQIQPICSTIIIGHFRTDAETTKIKNWRVRELLK